MIYFWAIIGVIALIAVARILKNIRYLEPGAITPEKVVDDRIAARKAFWERWFNRKKPVVVPDPPAITPPTEKKL